MERESFTFYRSYYEAIKNHPRDVQYEIYTAIMEYALYGNLPENPKPITASVFALVRPMIDANTARYVNGKKGGRKSNSSQPTPTVTPAPVDTSPAIRPQSSTVPIDHLADIASDTIWVKSVCSRLGLSDAEFNTRLDAFINHCRNTRDGKPHADYTDAKRHFTNWMRKAYPVQTTMATAPQTTPDYTFKGGFGGVDT